MCSREEETIVYEPISFLLERPNVNPDSPRHFKNKRRRSTVNSKLKRRPRSFNFVDGREEKSKDEVRNMKSYSCDESLVVDTSKTLFPFEDDNIFKEKEETKRTTETYPSCDETPVDIEKSQFTFENDKCFNCKDETYEHDSYKSKRDTLTISISNSSGFCDGTETESEADTLSSDGSLATATARSKTSSNSISFENKKNLGRKLHSSADSFDGVTYADSGIVDNVFNPNHTKSCYEKTRKTSGTFERYIMNRQTRSNSIDLGDDSTVVGKSRSRKISIEQCIEKLTISSRNNSISRNKLNNDKKKSRNRKSPPKTSEKKRRITVTFPLRKESSVFRNIRIESVL